MSRFLFREKTYYNCINGRVVAYKNNKYSTVCASSSSTFGTDTQDGSSEQPQPGTESGSGSGQEQRRSETGPLGLVTTVIEGITMLTSKIKFGIAKTIFSDSLLKSGFVITPDCTIELSLKYQAILLKGAVDTIYPTTEAVSVRLKMLGAANIQALSHTEGLQRYDNEIDSVSREGVDSFRSYKLTGFLGTVLRSNSLKHSIINHFKHTETNIITPLIKLLILDVLTVLSENSSAKLVPNFEPWIKASNVRFEQIKQEDLPQLVNWRANDVAADKRYVLESQDFYFGLRWIALEIASRIPLKLVVVEGSEGRQEITTDHEKLDFSKPSKGGYIIYVTDLEAAKQEWASIKCADYMLPSTLIGLHQFVQSYIIGTEYHKLLKEIRFAYNFLFLYQVMETFEIYLPTTYHSHMVGVIKFQKGSSSENDLFGPTLEEVLWEHFTFACAHMFEHIFVQSVWYTRFKGIMASYDPGLYQKELEAALEGTKRIIGKRSFYMWWLSLLADGQVVNNFKHTQALFAINMNEYPAKSIWSSEWDVDKEKKYIKYQKDKTYFLFNTFVWHDQSIGSVLNKRIKPLTKDAGYLSITDPAVGYLMNTITGTEFGFVTKELIVPAFVYIESTNYYYENDSALALYGDGEITIDIQLVGLTYEYTNLEEKYESIRKQAELVATPSRSIAVTSVINVLDEHDNVGVVNENELRNNRNQPIGSGSTNNNSAISQGEQLLATTGNVQLISQEECEEGYDVEDVEVQSEGGISQILHVDNVDDVISCKKVLTTNFHLSAGQAEQKCGTPEEAKNLYNFTVLEVQRDVIEVLSPNNKENGDFNKHLAQKKIDKDSIIKLNKLYNSKSLLNHFRQNIDTNVDSIILLVYYLYMLRKHQLNLIKGKKQISSWTSNDVMLFNSSMKSKSILLSCVTQAMKLTTLTQI